MPNRLQQLHDAGVSLWLDFIERTMLHNGDLERRIREDALTGLTSNPTIFATALAEGDAYDAQLRQAAGDLPAMQLFELVATTDVRDACDRFRGVYDKTKGDDGYVSIEVSPAAANNVKATVDEAQRLWKTVNRPNLFVKVPGTVDGAAAVQQLIAMGINVNITLLFALEAHDRVINAYMAGLEERVKRGQPADRIASVASFFVSRVDSEVDKRIDAHAGAARKVRHLDAGRDREAPGRRHRVVPEVVRLPDRGTREEIEGAWPRARGALSACRC